MPRARPGKAVGGGVRIEGLGDVTESSPKADGSAWYGEAHSSVPLDQWMDTFAICVNA